MASNSPTASLAPDFLAASDNVCRGLCSKAVRTGYGKQSGYLVLITCVLEPCADMLSFDDFCIVNYVRLCFSLP